MNMTLEKFMERREQQARADFERETEVKPLPRRATMHPARRLYLHQAGKLWARGRRILFGIHREIEDELSRMRSADEMLIDIGR